MTLAPFLSNLDRRRLLLLTLAGAGSLATGTVRAQAAFPSQPLRLVVPFGPGGLADVSSRLVAQKLGDKLGQQILIENRPGAGGIAAANAAMAAPADGHTLILFSNGTTIAKSLLKLPYDPEVDFIPVSTMAYFDLVLLVRRDSPVRDVKALLAEGAKRQLTFGTINPGSTQHLSGELFKSVTGVNAVMVPFKTSGEVQAALQRGDVDVGFESYTALRGAVDAGVLRAIASTGPSSSAWLPQVPSVKQSGVANYEVTGWNAIYTTKGTPRAVQEQLSAAVREVVAMPEVSKRLTELGVEPKGSSTAELAALFERDRNKWAQVIRSANIKV